jgi:pimeloyl-[acyl-carrier protein] methyl ester esterase
MTPSRPIVLLHGWGFTPAVWAPLIEALTSLGIDHDQIHTPALPLHASELHNNAPAWADLLPPDAHLVGWSLGGELALSFALTMPERLASLTLISSTPCFLNQGTWSAGQPAILLDDFDQRLTNDPAALLKRFGMLIRHGDADAARDRSLGAELQAMNETNPNRLAIGLNLLRDIDLRDRVQTLGVACQLIHGTQDAVIPFTAAEWLQRALGADLYGIDGASHALPITHPTQIASLLATRMERRI